MTCLNRAEGAPAVEDFGANLLPTSPSLVCVASIRPGSLQHLQSTCRLKMGSRSPLNGMGKWALWRRGHWQAVIAATSIITLGDKVSTSSCRGYPSGRYMSDVAKTANTRLRKHQTNSR